MMIKKKITQSILAIALGTGVVVAAVIDPNMRMEKMKELFSTFGADTFKLLNGQDIGGTGGDGHTGKGLTDEQRAEINVVVGSTDPNAFVFCVRDGKWASYPPEPTKVGTNAMSATDSRGAPFVETLIKAIRNSSNGQAHVTYHVKTPAGEEERVATVWSSKNLLSRKNDTGQKFFCGTSIKASH